MNTNLTQYGGTAQSIKNITGLTQFGEKSSIYKEHVFNTIWLLNQKGGIRILHNLAYELRL